MVAGHLKVPATIFLELGDLVGDWANGDVDGWRGKGDSFALALHELALCEGGFDRHTESFGY